MSATKSGVTVDLKSAVLKKVLEAGSLILSGKRDQDEQGLMSLDLALNAFFDAQAFEVKILKPSTFGEFLGLKNPTQGIFNQLTSEIPFWVLLHQIEVACFLQPQTWSTARQFIADLWQNEVSLNPFKPPEGWQYLPVTEAIEAYRKLFGSGLKASSVLEYAKRLGKHEGSEGIATWIKLSTLAKLFNVSSNPLRNTEEGREAYARTVELFVPEVGKAYQKVYPDSGFKNWRESRLSAKHVILTPAGLRTWQDLEQATDDDFVAASANSGSLHAGHSIRCSRIGIVRASSGQFPQDSIMTGGTIATQPNRLTRLEDLGMECPGNAYSSDADDRFARSLCWRRDDCRLHFDGRFTLTGPAFRGFGSAVLFRS